MSYVYFISAPATNSVKIGFTKGNPHKRLANMQTGNADKLELIGFCTGSEALEREFHEWFTPYNIRGEWFSFEGDFKNFCDAFRAEYWSRLGAQHEAEVS